MSQSLFASACEIIPEFPIAEVCMSPREFVKVAEVSELPPGAMRMVEVDENQVLLANVDGNLYACDNVCPHSGGPLAEGELNEEEVECPWHGSVFNVTSGQVIEPPAEENLRMFDLRIEGMDVLVRPPEK